MTHEEARMRTTAVAWLISLAVLSACGSDTFSPERCGAIQAVVSPATPSVAMGYTDTLRVTAPDESPVVYCGRDIPADQLTWSSSSPGVATVDPASGVVTALNPGTTSISVRWTRSDSIIATVELAAYQPLRRRIVFTKHSGDMALWSMSPGEFDAKLLIGGLDYPEQPDVSPDGRQVVYENWGDIYVVDGAGRNKRRIHTGMENNGRPSWSPDGAWILFDARPAGEAVQHVFLIHADGTGLHRLTDYGGNGAFDATWSPDGTRIAFLVFRFNYYDAVIMDTTGANQRVLTAALDEFSGRGPSWSPDGQSLLFLGGTVNGCFSWCIQKVDVATGTLTTLADAQGNRAGDWSPDGSQIVYGVGDLWLMAADGSNQRIIFSDGDVNLNAAWAR
jgi:hypothetical protein